MMPEDDIWIVYGTEAVKRVIDNQTISKHFTEAARVMKLESYGEVIEHFKKLVKILKQPRNFYIILIQTLMNINPLWGILNTGVWNINYICLKSLHIYNFVYLIYINNIKSVYISICLP
jgi:hypothetical protein